MWRRLNLEHAFAQGQAIQNAFEYALVRIVLERVTDILAVQQDANAIARHGKGERDHDSGVVATDQIGRARNDVDFDFGLDSVVEPTLIVRYSGSRGHA